jgi:dihydrofolate reductase
MRRLRYQVASSLDAYIAGANGEFDWIVMDPEIDFGELFNQFDTAVMGRRTFEVILKQGGNGSMAGLDVVVFSQTLQQKDFPAVLIVNTDPAEAIRSLKTKPGKDIWLYGGGELFRTLLDAGLVDTVEPAVIPVMLGGGVPLLPPTANRTQLTLIHHRLYQQSGIMLLEYAVKRSKEVDSPE